MQSIFYGETFSHFVSVLEPTLEVAIVDKLIESIFAPESFFNKGFEDFVNFGFGAEFVFFKIHGD